MSFDTGAAELRRLMQALKDAFTRRSESNGAWAQWEEAARALWRSYDRLAFPGGLDREFAQLKAGDPEAVELAVQFLEADPWYFRSGYHKADFLRLLRRQSLTEEQRRRLCVVILNRVRGRTVREMRNYRAFAPFVADPEFERELEALAQSADPLTRRHAGWVLDALKRSAPKESVEF